MSVKSTINSDRTLQEAHAKLDESYQKHRFVRMSLVEGLARTLDQNSMNFELYTHIGEQLYGGDTQHARNECKLDIGVPIMRRDSEDFNDVWQRTMMCFNREFMIKAMPMIQVTSMMVKKQNVEYINKVLDVYAVEGVVWPDYLTTRAKMWKSDQSNIGG